ncbi:hypothetical protein C9439_01595 [archaeon SCG-AAA382B04]|nr:hypothetical protein C9439_01595 [archaeon SCG-AAA382B04]
MIFEPKKVVKKCEKKGADEAEVYYQESKSQEVEIEKDKIKYSKTNQNEGIGIRVIVNKKVGFASTNRTEKIDKTIESAISQSKINNLELNGFPSYRDYPDVDGVFDEKIEKSSPESLVEKAKRLISATKDEYVQPASGSVSTTIMKKEVMNSSNIRVRSESTIISGEVEAIARSKEDTASAVNFQSKRSLNNFDIEKIGKEAKEVSKNSLDPKKPSKGEKNIVLEPIAASSLLMTTLIPSLSAEEIQKGRSKAGELVGQKIAPQFLKIVDDATKKGGLGARKFDDEAVPSQKNEIVEDGVLKNIFHNLKTSQREGVESTGNAIRSSITNTPSISPANFMIKPRKDTEKIIQDGDIVIRSILGAHTANKITGDFSVGIKNGYEIKEAQKQPISQSMISGNIYELIQNIQEIGKDTRQIGSIITPSVKTKARISN